MFPRNPKISTPRYIVIFKKHREIFLSQNQKITIQFFTVWIQKYWHHDTPYWPVCLIKTSSNQLVLTWRMPKRTMLNA
jgi:hypothetical protein